MKTVKDAIIEIVIAEFNKLYKHPLEIRAILVDFFGDENVDVDIQVYDIENYIKALCEKGQPINKEDLHKEVCEFLKKNGSTNIPILIKFPEVVVTNEFNESTTIYDTFIKINVSRLGILLGQFTLNRGTYTKLQIESRYKHSHASTIGNLKDFAICCLGSGPIRDTCMFLNRTFSSDMWKLWCLEIQKYLETESIAGGPYIRLESIRRRNNQVKGLDNTIYKSENILTQTTCGELLKSFFNYFISLRKIKFNYAGGWGIGMPWDKFVLFVSNEFIKWCNNNPSEVRGLDYKTLIRREILIKVILYNGTLMTYKESAPIQISEGETLFKFKGTPVKLKIIKENEEDKPRDILVLNPKIVSYFMDKIITHLNKR